MKKTLMVIMIVLLLVCNAYSDKKGAALLPKAIGPNTDLRVKSSGLTAVSVADLPSSPTAGDTYWVDDATSACVLGAGGGGVESEFKWDGSAWTGSLCSTGTGLAVTDIDTLAELNGIIGDANLYSTAEIDALLAKAALLGVLDLETTDSPTYAGMTLSGAGGLVLGAAGTVMGTARWYTNVAENVYRFDLFSSDFTQNWGIRWQTGYPTENGGLFTVGTTRALIPATCSCCPPIQRPTRFSVSTILQIPTSLSRLAPAFPLTRRAPRFQHLEAWILPAP